MAIADESRLAEVFVDTAVHAAARAAAQARAQNLSEVCRVIVTYAASTAEPLELPVRRDDGVERRRMRFVVNRVVYAQAKQRLRLHGRSNMSAYMETALEKYALTGKVR